ncbi:hypothetical protein H1V43_20970 [Streptomyces sp. PSKA54]|uniref:Uncharacterized protein n=1 Tax=Streptomyces himalayensis subsp. aureolus TaxID=2758039 RepID=A0A7W2D310_9ACTN|nr:hypothetical protein [Streptomyces himalayensis]MBA4863798.1 hypothetical protein [Streptomyces himalayensis subsp. aureolus]
MASDRPAGQESPAKGYRAVRSRSRRAVTRARHRAQVAGSPSSQLRRGVVRGQRQASHEVRDVGVVGVRAVPRLLAEPGNGGAQRLVVVQDGLVEGDGDFQGGRHRGEARDVEFGARARTRSSRAVLPASRMREAMAALIVVARRSRPARSCWARSSSSSA